LEPSEAGHSSQSQALDHLDFVAIAGLFAEIKTTVTKRDMPYHSLIKAWLSEQVDRKS